MTDLISRSKAIECVEHIIEIADKEDRKTLTSRILTSLYFQPIALRWIPVKERRPDIGQLCLITRAIGCKTVREIAGYWIDGFRVNGKKIDKQDVLAWMPLPEPYKEAQE